jgi:molecular chaperone GrpE
MHDGEKTMTDENESDKNEFGKNDVSPDEAQMLRAEAAELKDRLLRALADVENIRRRSEREKLDASQYAITKFARDVLAIADNFQRAIEACPPEARASANPQIKAVIDGVEATERQLLATLERHGVKPIDTSDARFDPNLHQAIAEVAAEGKPKGSIVSTVQSGYMIGERLLRPAMVTVARGETTASSSSGVDTKT